MNLKKNIKRSWLAILISAIAYIWFGYFTERQNFFNVLSLYIVLFSCFIYLKKQRLNFYYIAGVALGFRIILIAAIPNLSNDFYRFIWDGRMIWNDMNPFLRLPADNPNIIAQGKELYQGMGEMNGSHYTCYPPVNQLTFLLPAVFFSKSILGSVIVMRILIILGDIGLFYFGVKLLDYLKMPVYNIFWYILNPFIILELTGNLHFEGIMLYFLAWSLYLFVIKKWKASAVVMAFSIGVKLIPLLFLPLVFKKLKLKKSLIYYSICLGVLAIMFVPFVNQHLIQNFMKSINLYFQNFEFNASIYYIIREIGYHEVGYNIIQSVGEVTPLIILISVLILTFLANNRNHRKLIRSMLMAITIYYFLSTTIHPWYIAVPLFLCIFTRYRFPLVWSGVIILSYAAYSNGAYQENMWLITLEYILVYGVFMYEVFLKNEINYLKD